MHEVSQFISYEGQMSANPSDMPIGVQTRFTLSELQAIVYTKEQQLFQRAWLPCDAILAQASQAIKKDTIHVRLLHDAATNRYQWSVFLCDQDGKKESISSKKFTVKDGHSYYLDPGWLERNLQCEIDARGVFVIKSLYCDVNFVVHTNVATKVMDAQCLQSIYFDSSNTVMFADKCATKFDLIVRGDVKLLEDSKVQAGRDIALLTSESCDVAQGEIAADAVLKIYAPKELHFDITKLHATKMVDITLDSASQMQLVDQYKYNLTYAVLSESAESLAINKPLEFFKSLFIIAPKLSITAGIKGQEEVPIVVRGSAYMHLDSLALDKAFMHVKDFGLRAKKFTIGEVYDDIKDDDGFYTVSDSTLSVGSTMVLSTLESLQITGGDIIIHQKSAYIDAESVLLLNAKFISKAANSPVYMATQSLTLDSKTEVIQRDGKPTVDPNNDEYTFLRSSILRTYPCYLGTSDSFLYLPDIARIINNLGDFRTKLAVLQVADTTFTAYNEYSLVHIGTKEVRTGTKRVVGVKVGNKYSKSDTRSEPKNVFHDKKEYTSTTLIEGEGDLPVGSGQTATIISGNMLAPQRRLIKRGAYMSVELVLIQ